MQVKKNSSATLLEPGPTLVHFKQTAAEDQVCQHDQHEQLPACPCLQNFVECVHISVAVPYCHCSLFKKYNLHPLQQTTGLCLQHSIRKVAGSATQTLQLCRRAVVFSTRSSSNHCACRWSCAVLTLATVVQATMQRQLEALEQQLSKRSAATLRSAANPPAKHQVQGMTGPTSDQRLGRPTPGALSTKQPSVQPAVASSCFVKSEGSSAARPVGGGPISLTSMSRLGRHAVKPVGVTSDAQPAQQSADGSNPPQGLRSRAPQQHPEKDLLQQPSEGPPVVIHAGTLSRMFSLLSTTTAAGSSEADKQHRQHEGHMLANISNIYAQNQAIAAQQHALPVATSGTAVHGQPITSKEQGEAHLNSVVQEEKQSFRNNQAALQWLLLDQKRTALAEKLSQSRAYTKELAQLPGQYFGEPRTQAQ